MLKNNAGKRYAEVILPFPLNRTFSYYIPDTIEEPINVGSRVIVPFGRKKFYTAIVMDLHDQKPVGYDVKEITSVLDSHPVVDATQLKLWRWIADYYMCSIGEVYKAAIPSGFKLESETLISVNDDFEESEDLRLKEREKKVLDALSLKDKFTVTEIEKFTGLNNLLPTVKSLMDKEAVILSEEMKKAFKGSFEVCVKLSIGRDDQETLRKVFDELSRSKKQLALLMKYLELSGFLQKGELSVVTKKDILKSADVSAAVFKGLLDKGIFETYKREVSRIKEPDIEIQPLNKLNRYQEQAISEISNCFKDKDTILLHGVTSSGKTEVYIHLIEEVLNRGEQVLFLVPEIALTTQLTSRLQNVFGKHVAIYHSKFSDNERIEIWNSLQKNDDVKIVLGVRSSVFLPFRKLGLIIVDEEHEATYKQQDPAPRYNGKNVAMVLAALHGAKTLLGTATPSVESYFNAKEGKYGLVEMKTRHEDVEMPYIEAVDMIEERKNKTIISYFSKPLVAKIRQSLRHDEQVILFQNRRGFAPMIECNMCAWIPRCEHCDVSLTYHKRAGKLTCHYCGFSIDIPKVCPSCKNNSLETKGAGTEKIEEEIASVFSNARTARMDLDTTRTKKAYENIINDFQSKKTNVLVGTQMISKGLDFDNVNVVGIINADTIMNYPDFRAHERAFQMMAQVAGRAGRRRRRGEVIIQTNMPDLPLIRQIINHDYEAMYQNQIREREMFCYPPFHKLIYIYMKHKDENLLHELSNKYADYLKTVFGERVLGPDNPPVARIQSLFIRKIVLKIENSASVARAKELLYKTKDDVMVDERFRSLIFYYDVDPV